MSEPLSRQIRAFREMWTRLGVNTGFQLQAEGVQVMDALFASFQAQAKLLEDGPIIVGAGEKLIADIAAEARLCEREVLIVEDFVRVLRARRIETPSNVVRFPSPGRLRGHPLPQAGEGEGGAA